MIPIVHLKETPVAINYLYRNCLQIKVKEIFICKPKVLCTKKLSFSVDRTRKVHKRPKMTKINRFTLILLINISF